MSSVSEEQLFKRQEEQSKVALKYYESCRQETMERLKMRDQIVVAYVGAVVALFGYASRSPTGGSADYLAMLESPLFQLLPILLAFLALVASYSVAQHQEQIQALSEYYAFDLTKFLPACGAEVTVWEKSTPLHTTAKRALTTVLIGQIVLFSGPWFVPTLLYGPFYFHGSSMRLKDGIVLPSALIIVMAIVRVCQAWKFRLDSARRIEKTLPHIPTARVKVKP